MRDAYEVLAVGAHPDDVEVFMGGTVARLAARGTSVLIVDLCPGEPARHADRGVRAEEARKAAEILGADRILLRLQDRMIRDTVEARIEVAELVRRYRPRLVFTSHGHGVHPDHAAVTQIVTHALFYARLPRWEQVPGAERLAQTEPHEIDRFFFGHCRMEGPWPDFDFAVDVTEVYDRKLEALATYDSVFSGDQAQLLDRYGAEDRYVGSLVGVRYAEPFKARSPLLVRDPSIFTAVRYG